MTQNKVYEIVNQLWILHEMLDDLLPAQYCCESLAASIMEVDGAAHSLDVSDDDNVMDEGPVVAFDEPWDEGEEEYAA